MRNGNGAPPIPADIARLRQHFADANQSLYELCTAESETSLRLRKREDADAIQRCQAAAVRALHAIWVQWLEAVAQILDRRLSYYIEPLAIELLRERWIRAGAPADFDRALRDFFDRAGRTIFRHSDPAAAMRDFWEGPRTEKKRGRPPEDHTDRNIRIACEVAIDVARARGNYEAAVTSAMATRGLSKRTIEEAYRLHKDDLIVKATVELSQIWKSET